MSDETIDYEFLRLSFEGPLAVITFTTPKTLNVISQQSASEIVAALAEINKPRRKCRALLITGEGRAFSAGVNMSVVRQQVVGGERKAAALGALETTYHPMLRRLHTFKIPVVAGVNGIAIGIGLGVALAADYIVAAESAWFQTPFRKLATAPDSGLTWLLPRAIGVFRAKQMLLNAERIDARTAQEWGLVAQVYPDEGFADKAREVALNFANGATVALGESKALINAGLRTDLDSIFEAEAAAVARTARTSDNAAAVRLFASKEAPVFTGE